MDFISNTLSYGGMVLYVCLLVLLIRGPLSRYFPLFLFIVSYLLCLAAEAWALGQGVNSPEYFQVYWGSELLLDLLLFFLVISLTMRALEGSPLLKPLMKILTLVPILVMLIPFVAFDSAFFSTKWNNRVTELFNFGAAIMTLGLWTALFATKRRDRQLLTVSSGLGFALAGAALTMAVRHYTLGGTFWRELIDYLHRILNLCAVLIWCRAFWPARKPSPSAEPTVSAS